MPEPDRFSDALRRFSRRFAGLPTHGASPRRLLHRLLLGSDGAIVCGRSDERTLDCRAGVGGTSGKTDPIRTVDRAYHRRRLRRRRCRDVVLHVGGSCLWLNVHTWPDADLPLALTNVRSCKMADIESAATTLSSRKVEALDQ